MYISVVYMFPEVELQVFLKNTCTVRFYVDSMAGKYTNYEGVEIVIYGFLFKFDYRIMCYDVQSLATRFPVLQGINCIIQLLLEPGKFTQILYYRFFYHSKIHVIT